VCISDKHWWAEGR